jgi:hypothetical protein
MKDEDVPWGPLGYVTYKRTYARRLKDNDPKSKTEEFSQTIDRVVKACDKQLKIGFTAKEEKRLKEILMSLKGTVAGRFFWQLGTKTVDRLGLFSLQNCAGVVVNEPIKPFTWAMDALMLGAGVGYNIQKEYVYEIPKVLKKKIKIVRNDTKDADFIVPDSRQGWIELLKKTLIAHFYSGEGFSYSTICVRGKGEPIKGFGGLSSGPNELCWGIGEINKVLNNRSGKKLRPIDCLDIMNIIGAIVVAGNVRRSAQLAVGDYDDIQFLQAKRWDLGNIPNWRAMSNNTVVCNDFTKLPSEFWEGYMGNGEPYGLFNLNMSQNVGRTGDERYSDKNVVISNPCVSGDTQVLTELGYKQIVDILDNPIKVWNGFEWSKVTPKITGKDQPMLKITFNDGREIKCTDYHNFVLAVGYRGKTKKVEAKDLVIGDKLIKHKFPVIKEGIEYNLDEMYTQGFYSADGTKNRKLIYVYEPKYCVIPYLVGNIICSEVENQFGTKRRNISVKCDLKDKNYVPLEANLKSRLAWLAGILDGDGCELKEGGFQICSVEKDFLIELQKLLSTCGVNSKIVAGMPEGKRSLPNGKGGYEDYHCKESSRICVGAKSVQDLVKLGLTCRRLKFEKDPNRDASRYTEVVDIERIDNEETVYCFNEPKRHLGCFNGIEDNV